MHRRSLIAGPLIATLVSRLARAADHGPGHISAGAVTFDWFHRDGRLFGTLTAPMPGWLAVGFNADQQLAGTRFVIAALIESRLRAEEHVALVPDHPEIGTLGGTSGLADLSARQQDGRTRLAFSLPHVGTGLHAMDLSPGTRSHLMLAWSHDPDFDHHSAWRRHYDVTL